MDENSKNNAQIKKMAKIYESMKPKDAAKIFNDMQLNILLEFVEEMKEVRLAAVLAEMNPDKARELTNVLVSRKNNF